MIAVEKEEKIENLNEAQKKFLESKGLTMHKIAKLTGKGYNVIWGAFNNKYRSNLNTLDAIAKAAGVSLDFFRSIK
ncbi:XRE family transcriptional regulator [Candidatus Dojkabacteria bacterium]|jgi:transcriptional regulator with XRE-family HTH domain|uniref:XRE family transcriptional regulator n=1 Tax=Candidatus Dojkabacteria bacterium TaxID=2099670 RepID=A0A5C7J681_9BACT|nr:MAG: XRE family transcriptional regulator [Candidatus Dojkabacteria bacterium]